MISAILNEGVSRCTYGYIDYKKKKYLIMSIVVAVFMLTLGIIGFIIYGTIANYIMVPTMVSVIPLAMTASTYLAMVKFKTASPDMYSMVRNFDDEKMLLSDVIIVDGAGKRFPIEFIVMYKGGLVGYSSKVTDKKYIPESHVNDILKKRGVPLRLKIYNDWDDFLKRIDGINISTDEKDIRNLELARETIYNTSM